MMAIDTRNRPAVGEMLDAALALYELGFAVIPLGDPWTPPPPSVKADTEAERVRIWCKRPRVAWKPYQDKPPTEEQIRQWWGHWPYANPAVLTGGFSGCAFRLAIVDGDSDEANAWLETGITSTPVKTRTSRGQHRWYRMPKDLAITNAASAAKIDIRGEGGYVVAPGSTYADGTRNTWDIAPGWDLNDFNLLPELTAEDLGAIQRYGGRWSATNAEGAPQGDQEVLIDLGAVRTPHDGRPEAPGGRNNALTSLVGKWVQAGLAVDRLISKANEWNQSCPKPLGTEEVLATIVNVIMTHGRKKGIVPHTHEPGGAPDEQGQKGGVEVLSFGELADDPPAAPETFWQDGVLFRGARMLVAGPPKIGKSSLVIQLAIAAATGGELLGYPFARPLRVLWVQAEIHVAFLHQRLHRLTADLPPAARGLLRDQFIMTGRCDLDLLDGRAYDLLSSLIGDKRPDLLIIDPIINFSSADENDNAEMRKLLRLVDALGARHDCAIVLVHHTRKDASTGGFDAVRGASTLRGWFDTGLMLSGDAAQPVASYECRNAAALPTMLLEKTEQGRFIPCTLTDEVGESADPTVRGVMPGNARPNGKPRTTTKPTTKPNATEQHALTTLYWMRNEDREWQPHGLLAMIKQRCHVKDSVAYDVIKYLAEEKRMIQKQRVTHPNGTPSYYIYALTEAAKQADQHDENGENSVSGIPDSAFGNFRNRNSGSV